MKTKNKELKVYGMIGKSLCGCAGGIIGFLFGGPILAIPGIFVGAVGGHFLEKNIMPIAS